MLTVRPVEDMTALDSAVTTSTAVACELARLRR